VPGEADPCHHSRDVVKDEPVLIVSAAILAPLALGFFDNLADGASRFGYWAIIGIVAGDGVFPLLPGETAVITGGNLASTGRLTIELVILAGAVGAVIGDSAAYWIGRAGGLRIRAFVKRLAGEERVVAAEQLIARRGPALVFVGRFLPGIRLAVNVSCGAGHMGYVKFLIFDSLGAILWSTQASLLGYFLGKSFADKPWVGLLIALGVAALVAAGIGVQERRHFRAESKKDGEASEEREGPKVDEPVREP